MFIKKFIRIFFEGDNGGGGGNTPPPASNSGGASTPPPATSTPPPAAVPPGAATGGDWTASLTRQDLKDYAVTKGFKDPEMLLDSYVNLEKLRGVPQEQLLQLPKADAPAEEWGKVFNRLGAPEKSDGYKIDIPKEHGAQPEFVDWAKNAFHAANLTAKQAETVIAKWNEMNGAEMAKAQATSKAAMDAEVNALKTEWGNAFEQNMNVAKSAAKEFGIDQKIVDALEGQLGTKATMQLFQKIGSRLGEAGFTEGQSKGNGFGGMAPDFAKSQLSVQLKDKTWAANAMKPGTTENQLYNKLMKDAHPGEMSI